MEQHRRLLIVFEVPARKDEDLLDRSGGKEGDSYGEL